MKKRRFVFILAICIIVVASAFSVITSAYDAKQNSNTNLSSVYGDINGDGRVTTADSIYLQRSVIGAIALTEEQKNLADVDGNGKVSVSDAVLIQRYVVGIIDKFPVEEVATEPTQTATERTTDSEGWIEDVFKP